MKQRQQYEFLVRSVGQVVFNLSEIGTFTYLSEAWKQLLQLQVADCVGKPFIQFVANSHVHIFWTELQNLFSATKENVSQQLQLVNAAGESIWVRIIAKPTFDYYGKIDGFFGTIENINDQYKSGLLLQENHERFSTILNNSKEIILTVNLETNVIEHVNEAIGLLGYQPAEWTGPVNKLLNGEHEQKFHELMKLAVKGQLQVQNQQISFPHKTNSQQIPFEFSTSIFHFKNTKYLLCVFRDITERLKYEESLSKISTQLTHLINNIDDVYAIYDLKNKCYDFVSDNVETLYGCSRATYMGSKYWQTCIHHEDVESVVKEVKTIVDTKGRGELHYCINNTNGHRRTIVEKLIVGKDTLGNADKLYIVKTDYTHLDNARQSLLETERKFRFISENISDFISIHDTDWNFTYASPSVVNVLGFTPEDVLGLACFDLVHPDDLVKAIDNCLRPLVLEKKETQFRFRMRAKNNQYKWVEMYSKPVLDAKGEVASIISSTRNVTGQVVAESNLKESEEKYRLLSENSNDIIAIHQLNTAFLYISPSCYQVLGYKQEELLGKKPQQVFVPLDNVHARKAIENIVSGSADAKFVSKVLTRAGEEKLLEVWLKPVLKNGIVVAIQSASRDVTEREQLLKDLQFSLAKERELSELRKNFVSTASHQFRTPLTVIQSGVEIMNMYLDGLPEAKQAKFQNQFKKIAGEVERLEYLMNDVLSLERSTADRTPFQPVQLNLVAFCNNLIENYNIRLAGDRQILLAITGKEVPVYADEKLLGHALDNIITNACKYSKAGHVYFEIKYAAGQVILKIADQGIGIPEDDLRNLFQPFYRATNTCEFAGTGLGLSIAKEFIEKHGGQILIDSKLNKGTNVSVILYTH